AGPVAEDVVEKRVVVIEEFELGAGRLWRLGVGAHLGGDVAGPQSAIEDRRCHSSLESVEPGGEDREAGSRDIPGELTAWRSLGSVREEGRAVPGPYLSDRLPLHRAHVMAGQPRQEAPEAERCAE